MRRSGAVRLAEHLCKSAAGLYIGTIYEAPIHHGQLAAGTGREDTVIVAMSDLDRERVDLAWTDTHSAVYVQIQIPSGVMAGLSRGGDRAEQRTKALASQC